MFIPRKEEGVTLIFLITTRIIAYDLRNDDICYVKISRIFLFVKKGQLWHCHYSHGRHQEKEMMKC